MEQNSTLKLGRSAFWLLPLAALAFYMAFIPHQSDPYPVHIDEWFHIAQAEAILKSGSINYTDPFIGDEAISVSTNLEMGFQVFWGVFQRVSGISWMTIIRYFPSIILIFTMLAAYILGRRLGFGYEAAFFSCLIPTTIGILGPAFLVPVAMGIFYVPLFLYIAFGFRTAWAYLTLFIFTCLLVFIHAPSAICLVIILLPYIIFGLKRDWKHSLFIFLSLLVPFLAPFPWILQRLLPAAQALLMHQPLPVNIDFPTLIRDYGYIPLGLCVLGTFVLALKGGRERYGLVFGLLLILMMLVTFYTFHYGLPVIYERGLIFMMLTAGIVAGAGLMAVRKMRVPEQFKVSVRVNSAVHYAGWLICLGLVAVTLYISIPEHRDQPYYHMVNDEQYQAFVWIKDNLDARYDRAMLEPWLATPFTAITGKRVFTRVHATTNDLDRRTTEFLKDGCRNTAFITSNKISIVYTEYEVINADLSMVREHVYLVKK